jgi:hypothetical protein
MATTGFLFMLAFLGALGLALVRHPIYGLYAYIVVFYVHPPSRWWGAFLPDLRWSLLAAAVTMIALWRLPREPGRASWLSTTPARLLIAFTAWLWIQHLWTLNPEAQLEASILYTKYVILFYMVYRLVNTPTEIRRFMLVHVAGCAYLGVLAFTESVSGRLEGVGGPGIDEANSLAMQLATGAAIGAMIILAERKWLQWACIAAMAFVLNGMVLSGSRSAFLAALCAGLVMLYLKPAVHTRLFYGFAALGVALFFMVAPEGYWQRMGTITAAVEENAEVDSSAESRLVLIEAQWRMAKQYPLGTGHRGTEVLSPSYLDERYLAVGAAGTVAERARSSHNTFMSAFVEQGIPGALMFVALWGWCVVALRRLKRAAPSDWPATTLAHVAGVGGALAIVFVAGMFVDYLKAEVQIWLFALLASLTTLLPNDRRVGAHRPLAGRRSEEGVTARIGPRPGGAH